MTTKRDRRKVTGEQPPASPAPPPPIPPTETATDRRNWLRKQAGWPVKGTK